MTLAILGLGLFFVYAQRFEIERTGGEPVQIRVARKKHSARQDHRRCHAHHPLGPPRLRRRPCGTRVRTGKVLGLASVNALEANQALVWSDFADHEGEARDLSSLVPPDFRAVYIRAMREDQGTLLVRPGDFVDVVATMAEGSDARAPRQSVVLLQRVMVLANGMRTSSEPLLVDPDDKHPKNLLEDHGLTLNLSLQQAQTVAVAAARGQLTVALRNAADERTNEALPAITSLALLDPRARAAIQAGSYRPDVQMARDSPPSDAR